MIKNGIYNNRKFNVEFHNDYRYQPDIHSYEKYYIYCLLGISDDIKVNNKRRLYIGSTINLNERIKNHSYFIFHKKHSNDRIKNYVNKYGVDFIYIILEEIDINNSIEYLRNREQNWIDFFEFNGEYELLNIQKVVDMSKMEKSTKLKISENKIRLGSWRKEKNPQYKSARFKEKNPFYGKNHTEETKKIISDKNIDYYRKNEAHWSGKHHSEEAKNKISKSKLGIKASERQLSGLRIGWKMSLYNRSIPVKQIDIKTGNVINVWFSALDASIACKIDRSSISRCCNNKIDKSGYKTKSAGGYIWEFSSKE